MAKGLPKHLMRRVGKGEITLKQAWVIHKSKGRFKPKYKPKKRRKRKVKKRASRKTGRRNPVARRKKRKRRSPTIPIAPIAGLLAGLTPPAQQLFAGDPQGAANLLVASYTGWDMDAQAFNPAALSMGLVPLLIGTSVHILASKLGVNRILGRAGVPFVRI